MGGVEFHDPYWSLLLAVVAVVFALRWWLARRGRREAAIRFSNLEAMKGLPPTLRLRLRHVVPALRVLALAALVVALMRPQKGSELTPDRSQGISIIMAVDRSGSMDTPDFDLDGKMISRMDAVKKVFRDFVKGSGGLPGRPNDEIGIVYFAGYPVPVAPLTLDHGAVLEVLGNIKVYEPKRDRFGRPIGDEETLKEESSTAIGDGLAMSVDRLKDLKAKSKVIILMSDGAQNTGQLTPEEGADLARAFGIKIYSIGIGQAGVVMREIDDPFFGKRRVPVQSDLDEETMKAVAEKTGGKYFNAATVGALEEVYKEIDRMERAEIESTRFYRYDEWFQWAAIPGLLFLVLEALLGQTIFRRIP